MAAFVKELIKKKDEIEKDIKIWYDVLKTQGNVGMEEPLVDKEGYPRNDIDLVQVRKARHNIICLQNDHKAIMQRIEKGLEEYHAQVAAMDTSEQTTSTKPPAATVEQKLSSSVSLEPFAAVDLISRTSPAETAGLKIGDALLKFGSVTKRNFTGLNAIGEVVRHSVGKPINISVKRDEQEVNLILTPQEWEGRGLLGCNIVSL